MCILLIWCSASTMYVINNICSFEAMLIKGIYRCMQRLQDSDNLLIQSICKIMGYEI